MYISIVSIMQYYSIKFINYSIFQKNSAHYKVLFDTYNKKNIAEGI